MNPLVYPSYSCMGVVVDDLVEAIEKISSNEQLINECKVLALQSESNVSLINYWAIGWGQSD